MSSQEVESFLRKKHFTGASPPEIFVGRFGYPSIYSGILSPMKHGNTEAFSSPENWFKNKSKIQEISNYRRNLIYSRFRTQVKNSQSNFLKTLQLTALAHKSVSAEFFLKKPPSFNPINEYSVPFIGNPAPLEKIRLEENPKITKQVDYISSDTSLKAVNGIQELYSKKTPISNIIKILSAGLLGQKSQRKMVPTRWSITATDDTLSKEMLKQIRLFPEINDILVFHGEYLGNHYEILLLPDKWAFEVIEIKNKNGNIWKDHEGFYPRKTYASNVTGGYYSVRLPVCEYLLRTKRQATAIFFREVRPEYTMPLGVGILRETTRDAFTKKPEKFPTIKEALEKINERLILPISTWTDHSTILAEFGKQKRLSDWF